MLISKKFTRRLRHLATNRYLLGGLAILLLLIMLEVTNLTNILHKKPLPPVISVDKSESSPAQPSDQTSSNSSSSKDTKSGDTPGRPTKSSKNLSSPYGNFVSNHHPNLDGSPAPSSETSVCNTTPGAKCYIRFTMGSSSTTLPVRTANSQGTAFWSWDVKEAGLSAGNWSITAYATLNGQTKSAKDSLPLSVGN